VNSAGNPIPVNESGGLRVYQIRSMHAATLMFELSREADDSFSQVVRDREMQLLRVAFRILGNWADAEDVAQEAFLRLHRHGLKFSSEAALNSWLYRVAVNLCIDRRRRVRQTDELPETYGTDASAETELLRTEQKELLSVALARLPLKERAAVVLREIEGLETAEVAAVLGSSVGTVRSQISKAMTKLRGFIESALLRKER
jgi:RNA polymerase sigma-70 factor (ECF subfamily)